MSITISSVGFYDNEGTFFDINPLNGFPPNSTELASGVDRYVIRAYTDNNNIHHYTELVVSEQEAHFLSELYDVVTDAEYRSLEQ